MPPGKWLNNSFYCAGDRMFQYLNTRVWKYPQNSNTFLSANSNTVLWDPNYVMIIPNRAATNDYINFQRI